MKKYVFPRWAWKELHNLLWISLLGLLLCPQWMFWLFFGLWAVIIYHVLTGMPDDLYE